MERLQNSISKERDLYIFGLVTFLITFVIYFKTMAPTVSFWDCGEFIAAANILGVPHPPGAPFYLLLGRFFLMIPIFADLAMRVNLISALSSAFTILFTYLIIIQLVKCFIETPSTKMDRWILYGAASIGALCFAFSDTLWFNGVEAEVYALSTTFTALCLWLTFKWYESREELYSLGYLLLIMYLFGLAFGVHLLNILLIPSIFVLIFFYQPKLLFKWHFWILAPVVAFIGASTYFMIFIRAGMAPIINENDPSTLTQFWYYFSRKQYGTESLLTSLFNRNAPFWDYQVKFMYLRYFGWNFIGKGTTLIDVNRGFIADSFSLNGLKGLPFLVGVTGFFFHFRKDWKKALVIFMLFVAAGIGIIIYLNQPNPQPRERDYVYVGSFFAFALWIGIGCYALLDFVKKWLGDGAIQKVGVALIAVVLILINPVNQVTANYRDHDRTGNFLAFDYAYNMLITCEPNAIIFTNGDNDTFPLWYIQEVEKIRKDVKVVNLSLLNTNWYIYQLKHYEPKLDFGFTDEQIAALQPTRFQTQEATFTLPDTIFKNHFSDYGKPVPQNYIDDPKMRFTVEPTMKFGDIDVLRLQDRMTLQIVATNLIKKPIYFAITVDPKSYLGMRKFFRLDGINFRLTPVQNPEIHQKILEQNILENFQYRAINDPGIYLNFGSKRLLNNYRNAFMMLAQQQYNTGQRDKIAATLDKMFELIPDYQRNFNDVLFTENIGKLYYLSGREDEFHTRLKEMVSWQPSIPDDKKLEFAGMLVSMFNDFESSAPVYEYFHQKDPNNGQYLSAVVANYEAHGMLAEAIAKLEEWVIKAPQDKLAQEKLDALKDSLSSKNN